MDDFKNLYDFKNNESYKKLNELLNNIRETTLPFIQAQRDILESSNAAMLKISEQIKYILSVSPAFYDVSYILEKYRKLIDITQSFDIPDENDDIIVSDELAESYNECIEDIIQNPKIKKSIKEELTTLEPKQKVIFKDLLKNVGIFLLSTIVSALIGVFIEQYISSNFFTDKPQINVIVNNVTTNNIEINISNNTYNQTFILTKELIEELVDDPQSIADIIDKVNKSGLVGENIINDTFDVDEPE